MDTLRHPIASFKRMRSKQPDTTAAATEQQEPAKIQAPRNIKPRSKDPGYANAYEDTDTTRNIIEAGESMAYTLIAPPFPETLRDELRGDISSFKAESRNDTDAPRPVKVKPVKVKGRTQQDAKTGGIAQAKRLAAQKMKTPMQLRWETEHAKKVKQQKKEPLVSTTELLKALSRHMQAQRTLGKERKPRGDEVAKVEGVD